MATLAFYAIGAAIGPALAGVSASAVIAGGLTAGALFGAVGGAIGGFIDANFLFPAVFGSPSANVSGPAIEDVALQTASEGAAINECWGPFNPVAGEIIWKSPFRIEKIETETSGGGGKAGGGGGGVTSTEFIARVDVAIGVCRGPVGAIKKIWADSKVIYEAGITDRRVEGGIAIHLGSATQSADSTIEAAEGAANTPAYRGLCYVVIKDFVLRDWGNRVPRFKFLVEEQFDRSVADTIAGMCADAGLSPSQYDVTGVSGCLLGYPIGQVTNAARKIEPLMLAYDITAKEEGGCIYFFDRVNADSVVIPAAALGASDGSENTVRPFAVTDRTNTEIPVEIVVDYVDTTNDYQRGSWRERRAYTEGSFTTTKVDIPLVLRPGDAGRIARRILHIAEVERLKINGSLGPNYMHLQVTDVVSLPDLSGECYSARLTRIDRGDNNLIRFEAVSTDVDVLDQDADGEDSSGGGDVYIPPDLDTVVLDIPPFRESHAYEPGLYYAVAPVYASVPWAGATVFVSNDEVNWSTASIVGGESVLGTTDTDLAAGPVGVWDEVNSFTVAITRGTPASATDLEVLNGANRAVLFAIDGSFEIIGFADVVNNGDGTFTLSRLLRGLRDTDSQAFVAGSRFVLVSPQTTAYSSFNSSYLLRTRYFRGVASSGNIDDETSVAEFIDGYSVRCFAPCNIVGTRDGSNNLNVSWTRRSRVPVSILSPNAAPLEEPEEIYEIDVYDSGVITPNSPYTVTGESIWEYTAAMQTADGVTLGAPVELKIYQIGSYTGRGKAGVETV